MKRISVVLAALAALLVMTGSAMAATNKYKTSIKFHGNAKSLSFSQTIKATAPTSGARTNLIHDIKTTVKGLKIDASKLSTCTTGKINSAQSDTGCSKKALVAQGAITAKVGPQSPFQASNGQACDPKLDVWYAGKGKLAFFFVTNNGAHQCLGGQIKTGSVPPWQATYKSSGGGVVIDIPVPDSVDYPAGKNAGLTGSLESEQLTWGASNKIFSSPSCKKGSKYTFKFQDSLPGQGNSSATTSGKTSC